MDFADARSLLQQFKFTELFVKELGWSYGNFDRKSPLNVDGTTYYRQDIANLSGVRVFEISSHVGNIPDAQLRAKIAEEISQICYHNLIVFTDKYRTHSLWYWRQENGQKFYPREHLYVKQQSGDSLLSKFTALEFTIADFENGNHTVFDVAQRLEKGFDVERVTKRFYHEFDELHNTFIKNIQGIDDQEDRRWYASVILNRLMFVYFLQRKGFLDQGDTYYLNKKLEHFQQKGQNLYYQQFLIPLFFEGFAKPETQRTPETKKLVGQIKYLNGGFFLKHQLEEKYSWIFIPDDPFESAFKLFAKYSWNLDDTPGGEDNHINPDILGHIFEKYINQKEFGAYYTRREITEYLCSRTINQLIINAVAARKPVLAGMQYKEIEDKFVGELHPLSQESDLSPNINDILANLDASTTSYLLKEVLPKLTLLDHACGSGAFLVAAMKTLKQIYSILIGKIPYFRDKHLNLWLRDMESHHPSLDYFITKKIITENLYGVDIMVEATEIAKMRLFLALVSCAKELPDLEPLPNIDFNIMAGNSLVGLIKLNLEQLSLLRPNYEELLAKKNSLVTKYRQATTEGGTLQEMRHSIDELKSQSLPVLDEILLDEFKAQNIAYEEAQLNGKGRKRRVKLQDIQALKPFHWGYEFSEVIQERGGFDAIITNPPWEVFKPNAKEFFCHYSDLVTKKKMDIKSFEKQQKKLLQDPEIAAAWLDYLSQFPHVSAYYRSAPQYHNQISLVNGKKQGTDINLYKLFLEQCFNLLRRGGECGIVIPSGIYTDLGAKQLREMLFGETQVTGLFCFENRRAIFEGVSSLLKFVVLTFKKGGKTQQFPAEFMRHDVTDLSKFPSSESLSISVELVRRLSPDSISVMEFKGERDIHIAEKMARFPLLGEQIPGKWNLKLTSEFHMTNDSHLFQQSPGPGRLALYEGKMIHQFTHEYAKPRYWIDEREGRQALLGRKGTDKGQFLDYQGYRLGYRDVASNTNIRTMIAAILPPNVLAGNTLIVLSDGLAQSELIVVVSLLNSFVCDFIIRQKVTAHCNMFYIYQTPVPRLSAGDEYFNDIVSRAAQLICTTPEFDDLAKTAGIGSHQNGVTDAGKRAKLRAELDGIIAHLYGLTESEFSHMLGTFPIVDEGVKAAALAEFRGL